MRTVTLILLSLVALLAITELVHSQNHQYLDEYEPNSDVCDSVGCTWDCFDQGLHGECGHDNKCTCSGCIYRACRKYCLTQNRIGQCNEQHCACLA